MVDVSLEGGWGSPHKRGRGRAPRPAICELFRKQSATLAGPQQRHSTSQLPTRLLTVDLHPRYIARAARLARSRLLQ